MVKPQIPDKIKNQLEDLVKDHWVEFYIKNNEYSYANNGLVYNYSRGTSDVRPYETIYYRSRPISDIVEIDRTQSVTHFKRKMTIYDLLNSSEYIDYSGEAKYLYDLEKEIIELRKLKSSIDHIKTVLK